MERKPAEPVENPPNLVEKQPFDWDRLLSHIDPAPDEETEEFVRFIYEQRYIDASLERNNDRR